MSKRARAIDMIPGYMTEARYYREGDHPGYYRHNFSPRSRVRMYAMSDGSVLLKGNRRIHADDRRKGFDKYTRGGNPPMAHQTKDSDLITWLAIGGLLYWMLTQQQRGLTSIPAGTAGSTLPSGGSSNAFPDILSGVTSQFYAGGGGFQTPPPDSGVTYGVWTPPMQIPTNAGIFY